MKNRCSLVCLLLSLSLVANFAKANGPRSPLFLTNGDTATNWGVQGTVAVSAGQVHGNEFAVAVANDRIRTLGYFSGSFGTEYTTSFAFTGTSYPYPLGPGANIYDGTTDTMLNYSIDFNTGNVYSFNTDWTNPTYLFTTAPGFLGITYDQTDNSLWLSNFNGTTVEHRSFFGTLISSFTVPLSSITCLALDPSDDTLWMGSQLTEGTFYQYSKTGTQLSSVFYPAMASQDTLGGEFQMPAPTRVLEVNGNGKIGPKISFSLWDVENEQMTPQFLEGLIAYQDKPGKVSFQTGRITEVTASGNEAVIRGTAILHDKNRTVVFFTIYVIGNQNPATNDFFSISLSNGYSRSGNVLKGGFINLTPSN